MGVGESGGAGRGDGGRTETAGSISNVPVDQPATGSCKVETSGWAGDEVTHE